jgi:hypothetical protein
MMLPSALLDPLVELVEPESELPRLAIELSMNEEMIDCADVGFVEDVVPDVLELLAVSELSRFWNAELRLEVTLSEAPEPPSMLVNN